MKRLRVLIVDDSVVYRSQIRKALNALPEVEIVGVASNGRIALERLSHVPVDLLVLDLEMPEMNGLQTLAAIRERGVPVKSLVFSSLSSDGAQISLQALQCGASDFALKPGSNGDLGGLVAGQSTICGEPDEWLLKILEPKIRALFPKYFGKSSSPEITFSQVARPRNSLSGFLPSAVVIGSSTGGPTVLERIFSEFNEPLRCPIFIAQHMPPLFTAALAERLNRLSGIPVYEGKMGQVVENHSVYLAPGNFHMTVVGCEGASRIHLDQSPLINSVRPAVDPLFTSVAAVYGERCLGIVLTGMGADGKAGSEKIRESGGRVIIQSEASCVVFGMPGAVMGVGAYDKILSPEEITDFLGEKVVSLRENGLRRSS